MVSDDECGLGTALGAWISAALQIPRVQILRAHDDGLATDRRVGETHVDKNAGRDRTVVVCVLEMPWLGRFHPFMCYIVPRPFAP